MDETLATQLMIERAQLKAAVAGRKAYREQLRKQIEAKIPPEIVQELKDLDVEFSTEAEEKRIAELEAEVVPFVIERKGSFKVDGAGQAVFYKGKVSWKTDGLDALMTIEEVAKLLTPFRTQGDPYVTFR